jgi:hypothetical protein
MLCAAGECAHHDIRAARTAIDKLASHRAHAPAHQIALDRAADRSRHDEAEARRVARIAFEPVIHGQWRCDAATSTHDGAEVLGPDHPVRPGQHGADYRAGLGAEFGAPLAATSREDGAAGAGAHPKAETVDLCPPTIVRLEGALAHGDISKTRIHHLMNRVPGKNEVGRMAVN